MTGLTTHVLDLTQGKPADALEISFYTTQSDRKELIAHFVTNSDGRLNKPIFDQSNIREGWYEMVFHAGKYLVCLLYTSPSPRDRSISRMPSSA